MRLTAAILVLTGCGDFIAEEGSGVEASESRSLDAIDGVEVKGDLDVEVLVDVGLDRIDIDCDDNRIPLIETSIRGGELVVRTERPIAPRTECRVRVKTTSAIESLEVSGSSDVRITGVAVDLESLEVSGSGSIDVPEADTSRLDAEISGSGAIIVAGLADHVEADVSGSGELLLSELFTPSADFGISGSGEIAAHVTERLRLRISGSGDCQIAGDPEERDIEISGSGEVDFL